MTNQTERTVIGTGAATLENAIKLPRQVTVHYKPMPMVE